MYDFIIPIRELEVNTPLRGLTADHCLAGNFTLPIDFQRPGVYVQ